MGAWAKLHPKLQESPFYSDGRLLMQYFSKMLDSIMDVTYHHICYPDGTFHRDLVQVLTEVLLVLQEGQYSYNKTAFKSVMHLSCRDERVRTTFKRRLLAYFFVLTGYHRHVGFVGDYYSDPEMSAMSWKEGEAYGRPKQFMIMTYINIFTSTLQPLLKEDYTHMFKGMVPNLEKEYTAIWHEFMKDMELLEREVDRRNANRKIINWNMSPKYVETSVSK